MENNFEDIKKDWDSGKKDFVANSKETEEKMILIKKKRKENSMFYYGTVIILLITLVVISLFFYYVAPVKNILSRIGVLLMIGSLLIRIAIELASARKLKKINTEDSALKSIETLISFHSFRKLIHSPISIIIISAYTLGFYLITPEFSLYISFWILVLIDLSYVVVAIVLFMNISKGIKKEMKTLSDMIQLREDLVE